MDQFIRLLGSPSDDVAEMCAWALGNIAGDSDEMREELSQLRAVSAMVDLFKASKTFHNVYLLNV
jgi:hypothetical protein